MAQSLLLVVSSRVLIMFIVQGRLTGVCLSQRTYLGKSFGLEWAIDRGQNEEL